MSKTGFDKVLILGGGALALEILAEAEKRSLTPYLITSRRHVSDLQFASALRTSNINWLEVEHLEQGVEQFGVDFSNRSLNLCISNPWILKEDEIDGFFAGKIYNPHGTRLPLFRGAGGFSWQILAGSRLGAVTLYRVTSEIDAGPVVYMDEFVFPSSCRRPFEYENYYAGKLSSFLKTLVQEKSFDSFLGREAHQSDHLATHWPRLRTEINGHIDWAMSASEIYKFINAFDEPYDGARTYIGDDEVVLRNCHLHEAESNFHPFQSGIVYRLANNWAQVAASGGSLIIQELTDSKGENLLEQLRVGDRLHTPITLLDASKSRARLGPMGWSNSRPANL